MWRIPAEFVTIVSSYGRRGKNYFHLMSWQPDVFHLCFFLTHMQRLAAPARWTLPSPGCLSFAFARLLHCSERIAVDQAWGRPLYGKGVQGFFRSGVSQLCGSLIEGNHVAASLIIASGSPNAAPF